jgi:AAA domain
MAINRIAITSLRGIRRELVLNLEGKSLVLKGDNGTGKSSIVAGLRWALIGKHAPSLSAKKSSEQGYFSHVLEPAANSLVSLGFKGDHELTVTPGGVTGDDNARAIQSACGRANPFLLRRELLQFLEYKGGDRFKYLEAFLDLVETDTVREKLLERTRVHETAAAKHADTVRTLVNQSLAKLPRPDQLVVPSWSALVASLLSEAVRLECLKEGESWVQLVALEEGLAPALAGENLAKSRSTLQALLRLVDEVGERPLDPGPELKRFDESLAQATDGGLLALLEAASQHFAAPHAADTCPICLQSISSNVSANVTQRLAKLRELAELKEALTKLGTVWAEYLSRVDAAFTGCNNSSLLSVDVSDRPSSLPTAGSAQAVPMNTARSVALAGDASVTWIVSNVAHLRESVQIALATMVSEESAADVRRLLDAITAAKNAQLAVSLAESNAKEATEQAARCKLFAESIRAARQDVAQSLFDEIAALVTEFYTHIHGTETSDDVTGAPQLRVQRHGAGTVLVRGEFDKKAVEDPRWVYSDGHLDTVGICVFLALRRFRADRDKANDPRIMVLDDIVLSVDLSHGRRLLDLLKQRFADHQILIFTHNGLFFDWCVEVLPTFKRKTIVRWSLDSGPQLGEYSSSLEYIDKQVLEGTSSKLLAQAIMNLMDEWLGEARFAYALAVQARRGEQYTLTDLWNPFCKQAKRLEKDLSCSIGKLAALIDNLSGLTNMRNRLGAHENQFAKEYPLATVRDVAINAAGLVRTLYCNSCQNFAEAVPKIEQPEILRCKCESIRHLRPAKGRPT